jgi:hypothetical protein
MTCIAGLRGVHDMSGRRERVLLVLGLAAVLLLGSLTALPPSSRPAPFNSPSGSRLHADQTAPSYCGTSSTATLNISSPNPAEGPDGTNITLTGNGFYGPGQSGYVQIWLEPDVATAGAGGLASMAFVPANTSEPFNITLYFPANGVNGALPLGTYYLWGLNDTTPANCADAPFTLTGVNPGLACESWSSELSVVSPTPATGGTGTSVKLQGDDFYDNNATYIYWAAANGALLAYLVTVNSSATGGFNVTVDVPTGFTPGTYFFWGTDGTSDYDCSGVMFNLTASGVLVVYPTADAPYSSVAATGSGFADDSTISFTFDGEAVTSTCSTDASGSFPGTTGTACTFTVPVVPNGDNGGQNVIATDPSMDTASANFTVTPVISLSPSEGVIGSTFTVTGVGFSPDPSASYLEFNSTKLTPTGGSVCTHASQLIEANTSGVFVCTFTVPPSAAPGANLVEGDDSDSGDLTAIRIFMVQSPAIVLSSSIGPIGSTVTVTGSGFSVVSPPTGGADIYFGEPSGLLSTDDWVDGCSVGTITDSTVTVNGTGAFVCTFTVPSTLGTSTAVKPGNYLVYGEDAATGDLTPTETFTVPSPTIALSTNSGPVGSTFTVTGSGFAVVAPPDGGAIVVFELTNGVSAVDLTAVSCSDGTSNGGVISVDGSGGFVCTFSVPELGGPGNYLVYGADAATSIDTPTQTFTLPSPTIALSTNSGPVGSPFTIMGSGFSVVSPPEGGTNVFFVVTLGGPVGSLLSAVSCSHGTSNEGTITVDGSGEFVCTFAVPPTLGSGTEVTPGSYLVYGADVATTALTPTETFSVSPPFVVSVSTSPGPTGPTMVAFSLNGLAPGTLYDVDLDTTQGVMSLATYNPLGSFTSSPTGTLTDCTVKMPPGLTPGKYYVDLFEDPSPPPYIVSILNFTEAPTPSTHSSASGLSNVNYAIIGLAVVVAGVCAAVAIVRRGKKPRASGPGNAAPTKPTGPAPVDDSKSIEDSR